MRLREQLFGAALLLSMTYYSILRIAEAKCDAAVGSEGFQLDEKRVADFAAYSQLRSQLFSVGQTVFSDRLESLRAKGELWIAPQLGFDRWAAYVESLHLVRRIYVGGLALRNPIRQLFPLGALNVPPGHQRAFAFLSLAGAMRHELAHREGAIEEIGAYRIELAWYKEVRSSSYIQGLEGDERAAWDWGLDSAILTVRKAAQNAGAQLEPPPGD